MNWQEFITHAHSACDTTFFVSNADKADRIGRWLSGLLNTKGGLLVVGYDPVSLHLTGYAKPNEWIDAFLQDHFNTTSCISYSFLFRSNKKILLLDVVPSPALMPYNNIVYRIDDGQLNATDYPVPLMDSTPPVSSTTPSMDLPQTESAVPDTGLSMDLTQTASPNTIPSTDPAHAPSRHESLNDRQKTALTHVQTTGSIQNRTYRQLFDVSHKTAHAELADLVQRHHLTVLGSGRNTRYVACTTPPTMIPDSRTIAPLLARHAFITDHLYADEFNVDRAQAIRELNDFCLGGVIEKTMVNGEPHYTQATTNH